MSTLKRNRTLIIIGNFTKSRNSSPELMKFLLEEEFLPGWEPLAYTNKNCWIYWRMHICTSFVCCTNCLMSDAEFRFMILTDLMSNQNKALRFASPWKNFCVRSEGFVFRFVEHARNTPRYPVCLWRNSPCRALRRHLMVGKCGLLSSKVIISHLGI